MLTCDVCVLYIPNMAKMILRLPMVKTRTGLSRSTIYLRVATGSFPRPVSLGARAVGWLESDVEEWISHRIEQSRDRDSAVMNHEAR
jgi:prophage regulatory protein